MKKILKYLFILIISFVFLTNARADILYNNLTATIDGVDLDSDYPLDNAKIKYKTGTVNLNGTYAIFAASQSALVDSFASLNDSGLPYGPINSTNTTHARFYEKIAEKSNTVYTALYRISGGTTDRISNIVSIERPDIPLTKRIKTYFQENIIIHLTGIDDISTAKTVHYKIGQVTDSTLLNMIKEGTGNTSLLTYAKNASNPIANSSITGTGESTQYKATNNLSKSSFTNNKYYYVYAYRDTENGKYVELEDVNIYQYKTSTLFTFPHLVEITNSDFTWDIDDTPTDPTPTDPTPTDPTPTPTSTVTFQADEYVCAKNESIETYVVSSAQVNTFTSSNESIATIAANPTGTACPSNTEGCQEVKISCIAVGSVTVKAKNTDNKEDSASVEVFESLDPVTVSFNSNKGTSCSTKTLYKGQKVGKLCTPTLKGYTFDGWYTAETEGTKITSDTIVNEDLTLFARWTKVIETNPKTGETPSIYMLCVLIIIASISYIAVSKRNKQFNQ